MYLADSPRKKERREKLVKRFAEDWQIDISTGPFIRHRKKLGVLGLYQKFFGRKHTIHTMYWFLKHDRLRNEESRRFDFPLKPDNMPVPGIPTKYELSKIWHITEEDLKYLYEGPLVNSLGEVLVKSETKQDRYLKRMKPTIILLPAIAAALNIIDRFLN